MKKHMIFTLLFALLLSACAAKSYSPAVITASKIDLADSSETVSAASPVPASSLSVTISSTPSSPSSKTVSSKDSVVASSKANSKSTSSQQSKPIGTEASVVTDGKGLALVSVTSPIVRGQDATITVKGKPGIKYTIKVIYKSGASEAGGLEPKNAESDGTVTWTWKVGARTTAGNWSIEISGDGASVTVPFVVTE